LLGNPHIQTVLGNLWVSTRRVVPTHERQVPLPDGDRLVLHDSVPPSWRPGDRIAFLIHGLGGSHLSGHPQRLARRLLPLGVRVVRLDLRGCGRGLPLARRAYHGGCSADVRAAAWDVHRSSPASPLTFVGFSLGGNIVLKLAGEAHTEPVPRLEKVVAVAPPVELERSAALLSQSRNRMYERYFLRRLLRDAYRRQGHFPDLPAVQFPRGMTIRLFDELYTAPRWGFADADDYYRHSGSLPLLGRIDVPTLILAARDDPFVDVEPLEAASSLPNLDVRLLRHGGHLGYLGWDGSGGVRWAEPRVLEWVLSPS
jgi:predicted alpha/beta-fold hydrolase